MFFSLEHLTGNSSLAVSEGTGAEGLCGSRQGFQSTHRVGTGVAGGLRQNVGLPVPTATGKVDMSILVINSHVTSQW